MNVTAIFTCYNRKDKTLNCVDKLLTNECISTIVAVDDGSTDGTDEGLHSYGDKVIYVRGDGNLFWNRGMHKGIDYVKGHDIVSEYYLLVNDDVDFAPGVIDRMITEAGDQKILVGATYDTDGNLTYGGIKLRKKKSLKYDMIGPDEPGTECDTFNMNCALIPSRIFNEIENMDPYYEHGMGDFDYGFEVSRRGYEIRMFREYVGLCNENSIKGTWQDTSLGRLERIRKKESRKGLPFKDWFHYLNKNYGLMTAIVRSFTPYIKILVGR